MGSGSSPLSVRRSVLVACIIGLICATPAPGQSVCMVDHVFASDPGAFDSFGFAVAVSGDTVLVGADGDDDNGGNSGSAYVFRFAGTTWVQTQKLLASDGQGNDHFGHAVAIDGDTALVGAVTDDHNAIINAGSAYVFRFDPNTSSWIEEQKLFASDGAMDDGFGKRVAISGEVALISAPGDDDNGSQSGSAYVFRFDGSCWVEEQKLLPSDGASGDFFGISVAVSGDVAVIGAFKDDDNGNSSGSAYVFRFDGSCWVEEQKLTASDASSFDCFGESVSISGDVALVGATNHDHNQSTSGTAYVFRFDPRGDPGSRWVETQELLASDQAAAEKFGKAVAIDGDTAVIGDWNNDDVGNGFGAAHIFRFVEGRGWVEAQKLLPDPGAWTAFFGWFVALDGDTAVIGAIGENVQAGSAYIYTGVAGVDCNRNGLADSCEILDGTVEDANDDGIPDQCECPWDLDGSGGVGIADFLALLAAWGTDPGGPPDFDGDGNVGIQDFLALLAAWGPCP